MYLRLNILLIATLAYSFSALAEQDLRPERSIFFGEHYNKIYYEELVEILSEAQPKNALARVFVVPSRCCESNIGISEDQGFYSVFSISPEQYLYHFEGLRDMKKRGSENYDDAVAAFNLPDSPHEVKIHKCSRLVEEDLALKILAVWKAMLLRTRFPRYQKGEKIVSVQDGTIYYFGMYDYDFHRYLYGQASWRSDQTNARTGKLIRVSQSMSKFCKNGSDDALGEITKLVNELYTDLQVLGDDS